jgi:hypothetical protein
MDYVKTVEASVKIDVPNYNLGPPDFKAAVLTTGPHCFFMWVFKNEVYKYMCKKKRSEKLHSFQIPLIAWNYKVHHTTRILF